MINVLASLGARRSILLSNSCERGSLNTRTVARTDLVNSRAFGCVISDMVHSWQ
ncbi:hypothetical protein D3C76_1817930 [compost metagenome]